VYRAGAADADTATELAAGQAQVVAQNPEQGLVGIALVFNLLAVYSEFQGSSPLLIGDLNL
jgi:hypothetical protein